eukprot:TRINITY_DN11794_c0_g1_i1.p1 TRINITY_DN11794_c0_g1~~TRINITY_DN11794_c0_g1_i1.p1  ORF type:complete len:563 (+),score=185.37 TRINITY_DN11794_c0_g1_i1:30-1691(+)
MGKSKGQSHNHMYITNKEYAQGFGGKVAGERKNPFQKLPYDCCALSLTPFEDPVCTEDGIVYEILNIVPFIRKHKKDPISGRPLAAKDLIKLKFHKNVEGAYICPITYSTFTEHSHIVAIKTTGNVYSYDAIETMNIKPKMWRDLIDDTPFTRKDIITIQDPNNLERRNIAEFQYVKEGLEGKDKGQEADPTKDIVLNEATTRIFQEIKDKGLASKPASSSSSTTSSTSSSSSTSSTSSSSSSSSSAPRPSPGEIATGRHAAVQAPSFTSTGYSAPSLPEVHASETKGKETKKKGYVRMQTSLGDINIELHCDLVPKTTENFLELCEKGYYDGTIFHRNIPGFMLQGGDPTGTGKGGQSFWGKPFKDEFRQALIHNARGVLSMANKGPNTNGSQFFFLYKAASHLDFKHNVFGRIVGGMDILRTAERTPTDADDKPTTPIKIIKTFVFVNPFRHLDEEKEEERVKAEKRKQREENKYVEGDRGQWYSNPSPAPLEGAGTGVGKYLALASQDTKKRTLDTDPDLAGDDEATTPAPAPTRLVKKPAGSYGNFSNF